MVAVMESRGALTGFPHAVQAAIRRFAGDRHSGSTELARRACRILEQVPSANARGGWRQTASRKYYRAVARSLVSAQPAMAAVWNIGERWLCRVEKGQPPRDAARAVAAEFERAQEGTVRQAAGLIRTNVTVATYSRSGTVLSALLEARRRRLRFRVLCSESRPMMEGRTLAAELVRNGIPVEFFTDAGLLASVTRADLVLCGSDAVFRDEFVNKTGTSALTIAARDARVPTYVAADTFKFLPARGRRHFKIRSQNPAEVWNVARRQLRIVNFYFEIVPLRNCTAVVHENGLAFPENVPQLLGELEKKQLDSPLDT